MKFYMTYKKKCFLILSGFLFFLLVAYQITFSETLRNRSEIIEKETKIKWLKDKEKDIPFIKSKIELVEKTQSVRDSTSVRDKLTAFISDFSEYNNCTVTEIPVSSLYKSGNISIESNSFTIQGNFLSLLKLHKEIEEEFKFTAKVMSSRFFSVKENQTKRKNLYLTIITQSFSEINKS